MSGGRSRSVVWRRCEGSWLLRVLRTCTALLAAMLLDPSADAAFGDTGLGSPRLVLQVGHRHGVVAYAIDGDRSTVASLGRGDAFLDLWNVSSGRQYAACDLSQEDRPRAVTFHGGDVILSHDDGTLTQWSATTCERWRSVEISRHDLPAAVSWPAADLVATADTGRLLLLRGSDLGVAHRLDLVAPDRDDAITSLTADDEEPLLAVGSDGGDLWLVRLDAAGPVVTEHLAAGDSVRALRFAAGKVFAVIGETTIRWWSHTAGRLTGGDSFQPAGIKRLLGGLAVDIDGASLRFDAIEDSLEEFDTLVSWDIAERSEIARTEGAMPLNCGDGCSAHVVHDAIEVDIGAEGVRELRGLVRPLTAVAFDPRTSSLATGGDAGVALIWDFDSGQVRRMPGEATSGITNLAYSPDGRLLAASTVEGSTNIWSWQTEQLLETIPGVERPQALAFSSDSSTLLMGSETVVRLWHKGGSRNLQAIDDVPTTMRAVQLVADSRRLLTAGSEYLREWDIARRPRLIRSEVLRTGAVCCAAFSSRGDLLATTNEGADDEVHLYRTADLDEIDSLPMPGTGDAISALAFAPDDSKVSAAAVRVYVWDLATRTLVINRDSGHTGAVEQVTLAPNHRLLATTSLADAAKLVDLPSDRRFTLVQGSGGSWAAVSESDQRFDTNDFQSLLPLNWVVPDDPRQALPVEVFMRDYFEPRLVSRLLAGERLPPVRPVGTLNRARPEVTISNIEPEDDSPDLVRITLAVRSTESGGSAANSGASRDSGVYDLRLFRDGQLVGQYPPPGPAVEPLPTGEDPVAELASWRRRHLVVEHGERTVQIPHVRLPRRQGQQRIEFTAYAFNKDRVKSDTAARSIPVPAALAPRLGIAYVVTVGVNRTESGADAWSLDYAANDAFELSRVLDEKLAATRRYARIVPIRLVSDDATRPLREGTASKANLEIVLDLLAGRPVARERRDRIAGSDRIQPARPEDLLILAISSHGFTDYAGAFHFVLSDIGNLEQKVTPELARRTLSSEELSAWLRDVDAGDLVLIVDACQSAATIESDGFKPGPMGSRGLGQLAYDKGMRVLAASKSRQSAFEARGLRHGVLSYALTFEGLEGSLADWRPPDGRITIGEWLSFAERRVPKLFSEGEARGSVTDPANGLTKRHAYHGSGQTPINYQQPVLFDFGTGGREPVITKVHR